MYLNDAGTSVESVDHNSSQGECKATGGYWVPPQAAGTTYSVDPNGGVNGLSSVIPQPPTQEGDSQSTFFTASDCILVDRITHGANIAGMALMLTGPEDPAAWFGLGLSAGNEIWGMARSSLCP